MRFTAAEIEGYRAHQWWKSGDHPLDETQVLIDSHGHMFLTDPKFIRYFNHPDVPGAMIHPDCQQAFGGHGWIDLEGEETITVCPGNWVLTAADLPIKVLAESIEPLTGLVAYAANCRGCTAAINNPDQRTRDLWAVQHSLDTAHIADSYEIVG